MDKIKTGIFIASLFFILNILDGIYTHFLIKYYNAIEINPIIGFFIDKFGVWFILPKAIIGFLISAGFIILWKKKNIRTIAVAATIIYFLIFIYHSILLAKGDLWL